VVIYLTSSTQGLSLTLAAEGLGISISRRTSVSLGRLTTQMAARLFPR